jgi:glycosyltransferase involved in cell wall biosynthesis
VRLAVYTDYPYHRIEGRVYAERAFAIFLARLRGELDSLTLVGRLHPGSEDGARYPIGDVELVALPYYERLSRPFAALPALVRSLRIFWRALADVDAVWLLGPHPLATAFALLARARGKRVVLGVRQDTPAYVASRHPRRPDLRAASLAMEGSFRALARAFPVVVVGEDLAQRYRRARALLTIHVSLIDDADIVPAAEALASTPSSPARILSVGRLETEKNPLLLIDVLQALQHDGGDWRLIVCGEGSLEDAMTRRAEETGVVERLELRGYVPFGPELLDLYRSSDVLLHVSLTEGYPQVLVEAFASGVPVVATAVGGVAATAGDAAELIPPRDPGAAARAVRNVIADAGLRERLLTQAEKRARELTASAEVRRLARFLRENRREAPVDRVP